MAETTSDFSVVRELIHELDDYDVLLKIDHWEIERIIRALMLVWGDARVVRALSSTRIPDNLIVEALVKVWGRDRAWAALLTHWSNARLDEALPPKTLADAARRMMKVPADERAAFADVLELMKTIRGEDIKNPSWRDQEVLLYYSRVGDTTVRIFGPSGKRGGPVMTNARVVRASCDTVIVENCAGRLVLLGNLSPVSRCRIAVHQTSFDEPGVVVLDVEAGGVWADHGSRDSEDTPVYRCWNGESIHNLPYSEAKELRARMYDFPAVFFGEK
jgi:hypothetical protein